LSLTAMVDIAADKAAANNAHRDSLPSGCSVDRDCIRALFIP
jgi:hypothetical protein